MHGIFVTLPFHSVVRLTRLDTNILPGVNILYLLNRVLLYLGTLQPLPETSLRVHRSHSRMHRLMTNLTPTLQWEN
jgi:hypothetical protein